MDPQNPRTSRPSDPSADEDEGGDDTAPYERLRCGDLIVDTGRQQVFRGDREIKLPTLSYRLLVALLVEAPNVVSNDDIVARVWRGRVVSPEAITQRVKLLRQALGDDAKHPIYVGLVRGVGYRVIPDVESCERGDVKSTLVAELDRRRVLRVAFIYVAVAWTLTEAIDFLLETLPGVPEWSRVVVATAFIVGFPVAMFLSWRFDIGPDGVVSSAPLTTRDRATFAAALVLLVSATAGLSYLLIGEYGDSGRGDDLNRGTASEDVVALLPFAPLQQDPELDRLASGLNDELRDNLRRSGLKMVARRSSYAFGGQPSLITEISRQLQAGTLIEGKLSRNGTVVEVSVAIIDGTTGIERWSGTFYDRVQNMSTIENNILSAIVNVLQPSLAISSPQDIEPAVYNLMLLARHFDQEARVSQAVDLDMLNKAIDLYEQIVQAAPNSALAHSRLGGARLYAGDATGAQPSIFRALDLNPQLADVQYNLALYYWAVGNNSVRESLERAIELDPNHTEALSAYAQWIWFDPDYTRPLSYFQRALELDALSLRRYADVATMHAWRNEPDEVRRIAREIPRRIESYSAYEVVARLYELAGDLDLAIAWAWRSRLEAPEHVPDPTWQLAELYARIGDFDTADVLVQEPSIGHYFWTRRYVELADLAEELIIEHPEESHIYYQLAFAYNALGKYAAAVRILKLAGLPERVQQGVVRRSAAHEAMATLLNALWGSGSLDEARAVGEWLHKHMEWGIDSGGLSWWSYTFSACALTGMGRTEEALDRLDELQRVAGFVWNPYIRDSRCFRQIADEPRYRAVLATLDSRKEALRSQLPRTLEELGVDEFARAFLLRTEQIPQG